MVFHLGEHSRKLSLSFVSACVCAIVFYTGVLSPNSQLWSTTLSTAAATTLSSTTTFSQYHAAEIRTTSSTTSSSATTTSRGYPASYKDSYESSVECIEPEFNRSCKFHNMYYAGPSSNTRFKDKFLLLHVARGRRRGAPDPSSFHVEIQSFHSGWMPDQLVFDSEIELAKFVDEQPLTRHVRGVSLLIGSTFAFNFGHCIWDGFYPAFAALVKFGLHDTPFTAVHRGGYVEDLMERFAGKLLTNRERQSYAFARFDVLVAGASNTGNVAHLPSIAVGGSSPPMYSTALFRDRMLRAYNVTPRLSANFGRGGLAMFSPLPRGEIVQIIVVDNKRYGPEGRQTLRGAMGIWNEEAHGSGIASYVKWGGMDLPAQMRILAKVHVYVSSPGTGLLNAPFMSDGSILVALGAPKGSWGLRWRIPSFMEQNIAGAGTPYIKTIYMHPQDMMRPSNCTDAFLTQSVVLGLLRQAQELVVKGVHLPVPVIDNVSPDARVFLEFCATSHGEPLCRPDATETAPYGCATLPEWLVYEQVEFSEKGCKKCHCILNNRTLLRELKIKHRLYFGGVAGIDW